MRRNPYGPKFLTKEGAPLPDNLRFKGQSQPAIASSGHMNANNKRDLAQQISRLIHAYQDGDIQRTATVAQTLEDKRKVVAERRQILAQAYHDDETFQALGEVLAEDISETTTRDGFCRKFLAFKEIEGEPTVRFKTKDVIAYEASSATETKTTIVRNDYKHPQEVYVSTSIDIEERDIHKASGDILEEKYQEGLEAIMVTEDLMWKRMADEATQNGINPHTIYGQFTPQQLAHIKSKVTQWGIPVANCLLAHDLWDDIITSGDFTDNWIDPFSKYEMITEGSLGILLGMNLLTDAFRLPTLKVVDPGSVYVVGSPETHGVFMQRGDLLSKATDRYNEKKPFRGWYLLEMIAMMIVNAKSISAGKKQS